VTPVQALPTATRTQIWWVPGKAPFGTGQLVEKAPAVLVVTVPTWRLSQSTGRAWFGGRLSPAK